jgi:hypothetical protein
LKGVGLSGHLAGLGKRRACERTPDEECEGEDRLIADASAHCETLVVARVSESLLAAGRERDNPEGTDVTL